MEQNTDKILDIHKTCIFGCNKSENHVNMVIDGGNSIDETMYYVITIIIITLSS